MRDQYSSRGTFQETRPKVASGRSDVRCCIGACAELQTPVRHWEGPVVRVEPGSIER